jgi:hypothetical protein
VEHPLLLMAKLWAFLPTAVQPLQPLLPLLLPQALLLTAAQLQHPLQPLTSLLLPLLLPLAVTGRQLCLPRQAHRPHRSSLHHQVQLWLSQRQ